MRRLFLFVASALFLVYVLAPVAWLVSSSLQRDAEIVLHEARIEPFEGKAVAQLRASADRLQKVNDGMAEIIGRRVRGGVETARAWMRRGDDVRLDAGAAYRHGLVTAVSADLPPLKPAARRARFAPIRMPA